MKSFKELLEMQKQLDIDVGKKERINKDWSL